MGRSRLIGTLLRGPFRTMTRMILPRPAPFGPVFCVGLHGNIKNGRIDIALQRQLVLHMRKA